VLTLYVDGVQARQATYPNNYNADAVEIGSVTTLDGAVARVGSRFWNIRVYGGTAAGPWTTEDLRRFPDDVGYQGPVDGAAASSSALTIRRLSGPWAVSAAIRPANSPDIEGPIVSAESHPLVAMSVRTDALRVHLSDNEPFVDAEPVIADQWRTAACICDAGGIVRVYHGGELRHTFPNPVFLGTKAPWTDRLLIGYSDGMAMTSSMGLIRDIRLYDRAPTIGEIDDGIGMPVGPRPPDEVVGEDEVSELLPELAVQIKASFDGSTRDRVSGRRATQTGSQTFGFPPADAEATDASIRARLVPIGNQSEIAFKMWLSSGEESCESSLENWSAASPGAVASMRAVGRLERRERHILVVSVVEVVKAGLAVVDLTADLVGLIVGCLLGPLSARQDDAREREGLRHARKLEAARAAVLLHVCAGVLKVGVHGLRLCVRFCPRSRGPVREQHSPVTRRQRVLLPLLEVVVVVEPLVHLLADVDLELATEPSVDGLDVVRVAG
jgi:hypothetical protein